MKKLLLILIVVLFNCQEQTHCSYKIGVENYSGVKDTVYLQAYNSEQEIKLIDSVLQLGEYFKFKSNIKSFEILSKVCDTVIALEDTTPIVKTKQSPIITSINVVNGSYVIDFKVPVNGIIPIDGYDTFVDGEDRNEHMTESPSTITGLNTSIEHCFNIEARFVSENIFKKSETICK